MDQRTHRTTPEAPACEPGAAAGDPADVSAATPAPAPAARSFGDKVAWQMPGAQLTETRSEQMDEQGEDADDQRRIQAARFVDWRAQVAGMTREQRLQKTLECLDRRQRYQDILYGLLGYCAEERTYEQAEAHVASYPAFAANRVEARRYIYFLERTGAIDEIELGEDGAPLTEERRRQAVADGLDPEDLDELVFDWRLRTTDVGLEARELRSPRTRLQGLVYGDPERTDTYLRVLEYCLEPRSMPQVKEHLKDDPGLFRDPSTGVPAIAASSYVDKLDRAGGLAWSQGWSTTPEGEELLAEALEGRAG